MSMILRQLQSTRYVNDPKLLKPLKKVRCAVPFTEFHIYENGFVSNCCFSWMPTEIGNIQDVSLLEMLEKKTSLAIQESVSNGSYEYCSTENCPVLSNYLYTGQIKDPLVRNDLLHTVTLTSRPIRIFLSYDKSCNLSCESCRNEVQLLTETSAPPELVQIHRRVSEEIRALLDAGYAVEVAVTGSGDSFASPLFFNLMVNLPHSNRLGIKILTNGTMMTAARINQINPDLVQYVSVSVDAARAETYKKIRRGGHFSLLEKNIKDFDRMVSEKSFRNFHGWEVNFIVQSDNYREMGEFVDWSDQFKSLNSVSFLMIQDWGHLAKDHFAKKAIWMKDHFEHQNFLEALQDPRLARKRVSLGNLHQFRNLKIEAHV